MGGETQASYRFKIVICGDWAVGKSSLVRRFATGTFSHSYITTLAINLVVKEVYIDGAHVTLSLWDTGGQERFQFLRQKYYQGADGVVFAFDLTRLESFNHIEERWLPEVNRAIERYTPALWGTKADLVDQRVVETSSGEELASRFGAEFYETSALSGQNVEAAFHGLAQLVIKKSTDTP
ncbi:MAG: Rab family GTPase [Promethearchaeota archaeon]